MCFSPDDRVDLVRDCDESPAEEEEEEEEEVEELALRRFFDVSGACADVSSISVCTCAGGERLMRFSSAASFSFDAEREG